MIKYVLMTVPQRVTFANYLRERIPEIITVVDNKKEPWLNFMRSLEGCGSNPAVHFEDDIILTTDFKSKIHKVIRSHKDDFIQFFSLRKSDFKKGSRFEYGGNFSMNQCWYSPAGGALDMLNYFRNEFDYSDDFNNGFDLRMREYFKARKIKYFLSVPSLVQHRIVKSIANEKRSKFRQSPTFVNPDI